MSSLEIQVVVKQHYQIVFLVLNSSLDKIVVRLMKFKLPLLKKNVLIHLKIAGDMILRDFLIQMVNQISRY